MLTRIEECTDMVVQARGLGDQLKPARRWNSALEKLNQMDVLNLARSRSCGPHLGVLYERGKAQSGASR